MWSSSFLHLDILHRNLLYYSSFKSHPETKCRTLRHLGWEFYIVNVSLVCIHSIFWVLVWLWWVDSLYNLCSYINHFSSKNPLPNDLLFSFLVHFLVYYISLYTYSNFRDIYFSHTYLIVILRNFANIFIKQIQMEKESKQTNKQAKNTIESPSKESGQQSPIFLESGTSAPTFLAPRTGPPMKI